MKLLVLAAAIIWLLANGTASPAEKIRVGVPQQVVHWMVFPLAQQKGLFKEEGFDAEIVRITGPSGRSALMSGDIDYYTTIACKAGDSSGDQRQSLHSDAARRNRAVSNGLAKTRPGNRKR